MVEKTSTSLSTKTSPGKQQKPNIEALSAKQVLESYQATLDIQGEFKLPQISDDELRQFTIPEALSEAERCKLLLSKQNDPCQQSYVFQNAKNIFKDNPDQIQEAVIPQLLRQVQSMPEQSQIQAGEMLDMLVRDKIITQESLIQQIAETADLMTQNWNQSVLQVWLKVKASSAQTKREIINLIAELTHGSQPVQVKCSSCVLMANMVDKTDVDLYKDVKNLAQDFIWKVRLSAAENIENIPMPIDKKVIILDELVQDEEREVSIQASNAIASLILKQNEVKLFDRYLKLVQNGVVRPQQAMEKLPQILCVVVTNDPSKIDQNGAKVLEILKKMSQQEYDRQLCAYAMLDFGKAFKDKFFKYLYTPFYKQLIDNELAQANDLGCKVQLAETIVPICIMQQTDAQLKEDLQNQIIGLLKFGNSLIIQRIMEGLIQNSQGEGKKAPEWSKVCKILHHLMKGLQPQQKNCIQRNWRVQRDLITILGSAILWQKEDTKASEDILQYLLQRHQFYDEYLPSMPAKQALADAMANLISSSLPSTTMRGKINQGMVQYYSKADSSQLRIVWVLFIQNLCKKISAKQFEEVYAMTLLEAMKTETVASLATMYIRMIPDLTMRLNDTDKKQKLAQVLKHYQNSTFKTKPKLLEELEKAQNFVQSEEYQKQYDIWAEEDKLLEKRDFNTLQSEQKGQTLANATEQKLPMPQVKKKIGGSAHGLTRDKSKGRSSSQNSGRANSATAKQSKMQIPIQNNQGVGFGTTRINSGLPTAPTPNSARTKK